MEKIKRNDDEFKEEDFTPVKLPQTRYLKGTRQGAGPWERLQIFFKSLYKDIEDAKKDFKKFYLRKDDVDAIHKLTQTWCKLVCGKSITKHHLDNQVGWYELDMAPIYFYCNPSWTKKGYGYVRKTKEGV